MLDCVSTKETMSELQRLWEVMSLPLNRRDWVQIVGLISVRRLEMNEENMPKLQWLSLNIRVLVWDYIRTVWILFKQMNFHWIFIHTICIMYRLHRLLIDWFINVSIRENNIFTGLCLKLYLNFIYMDSQLYRLCMNNSDQRFTSDL